MKRVCACLLVMIGFCLMASSVEAATTGVSHYQQNKLQTALDNSKANVMVLVNGRQLRRPVILQHSTVESDSPQALHANRPFPVGSTQKILTAWLILQAVKNHHLTLGTKLNQFFPQVQNSDQITIWQLLTHTSGLADDGRFAEQPLTTEQDQLNYSLGHYQSTGGHGWQYASINYVFLAGILTKVNHQSYAEQVEARLIRPNHLHHTKFYYQIKDPNQVQQSCLLSGDPQTDWQHLGSQMSTTLGAGDLLSSPNDYWVLINRLFVQHHAYFKQVLKTPVKTDSNYFAGMYRRGQQMHSNGTVDGYTCVVSTDGQKTMLVFSNTLGAPEIDQLADQLAKIYY